MVLELKYLKIEYNKNLEVLVKEIQRDLEEETIRIISFFEIDDNFKVRLKIFDSLFDFKKEYLINNSNYRTIEEIPSWVCGFALNKVIYVLSLEEFKKIDGNENLQKEDLINLIIHEFVHLCEDYCYSQDKYLWISEGMATYLANQYKDDDNIDFDANLNELLEDNATYYNNYLLFKYAYESYGKGYILKLLKDKDLLEEETIKLYQELKEVI